jgi:predicted esterase
MSEAIVGHVPATVHGRFLLDAPAAAAPLLVVGFHGYAESADAELARLRRIPGSERFGRAAIQALHPFYTRANEVVASWMTRQDRELAIAENVRYVDAAITEIKRRVAAPRLALSGFSQGVAMAYRAAVRGTHACHAMIALGGDVPPELKVAPVRRFPPVLVCRGRNDTWYTDVKLDEDRRFLSAAGSDVTCLTFAGGHEWTAEVGEAAARFLSRVQLAPADG